VQSSAAVRGAAAEDLNVVCGRGGASTPPGNDAWAHFDPDLPLAAPQKNYDAFTNELSVENMDPNQPDSKGRLPLMEAVRSKDLRFVDALIQFGATANSRDPASGSSPVSHAMQTGQAEASVSSLSPLLSRPYITQQHWSG
jgi:ankyrin repeat protein